MSLRQSDIIHRDGDYFILRVSDGVEVNRNSGTHSVRCAGIYFKDHAQNMERARAEITRRRSLPDLICRRTRHAPQAPATAIGADTGSAPGVGAAPHSNGAAR